ncbi:MAG: DUF1810 family protein [Muribaculaceae bacterium]|nr:DUF1810 family protein [Muribaculaceae bacterium]
MLQFYSQEALKKGIVINPFICIERFRTVSDFTFDDALQEVKNGKKEGHWMWWTFPQMKGLGKSERSFFYGLSGQAEARAYYDDPVLGPRLVRICQAVLDNDKTVYEIFGEDAIKVRACCKLFAAVCDEPVFQKLIERYMWY